MDVGLIFTTLVGLAIAVAIAAGVFAARVFTHAAEHGPGGKS